MLDDFLFDSFWDAFGDVSIGIAVIDCKGKVRYLNSMAGYLLSVQPSLSLGRPVEEIIQSGLISDAIDNGIAHIDKSQFINGRQLKCTSIPIKIKGQVVCAVELMRDHTEKNAMADELAELREKYDFLEMLLDEAFEEVAAVNKNGLLTYISKKSAKNLGFSREELLGRDISTIDKKCLLKWVAERGVPRASKIDRPYKKTVPVMVVPLFKKDELSGAVCRSIFTDMNEATEFVSQIQKMGEKGTASPCPRSPCLCKFSFADIIGESKTIRYAKKKASRVAEGDSTVLITGDSGTGKELFAHAIHMASLRRKGALVKVNCAGIPENLLESELFGYEPGAFTGARKEGKPGKFELAHNGTIFLDEIGDMSMGMQAKLLRVIQDNEIERIGGTACYEVDVRILCATNRDLWDMVQKGEFREDLYYRLDVINIHIPPLRERIEDIPLLIGHFIPLIKKRAHSKVTSVSHEVLDCFMGYGWPGNVRELKNVLEGAMNLNTGDSIAMEALPSKARKKMTGQTRFRQTRGHEAHPAQKDLKAMQKAMIEQALITHRGNKRQAALELNISRSTLYNKLKSYTREGNVGFPDFESPVTLHNRGPA